MSAVKPNLSKQLADLQEIVDWFEQDDIDVEAAIKKFEAGQKLAETIKSQLETLENNITVLKKRFDTST